jgi:hypothetical protein
VQGVEYCSSNDVVQLTLFIFVVVFLTKVMNLIQLKQMMIHVYKEKMII